MQRALAQWRKRLAGSRTALYGAAALYAGAAVFAAVSPFALVSTWFAVVPVLGSPALPQARAQMYAADFLLWLAAAVLAAVMLARLLPRGRVGDAAAGLVAAVGLVAGLCALWDLAACKRGWHFNPLVLKLRMWLSQEVYAVAVMPLGARQPEEWLPLLAALLPLLLLLVMGWVLVAAAGLVALLGGAGKLNPHRLVR